MTATALVERLMSRVVVRDTHWIWQGATNDRGYAVVRLARRNQYVHRVLYVATRGAIPAGCELDHLCRIPSCVAPMHMEAVSHTENVRRGQAAAPRAACKRGHPLVAGNVYVSGQRRQCRTCAQQRAHDRHHGVQT